MNTSCPPLLQILLKTVGGRRMHLRVGGSSLKVKGRARTGMYYGDTVRTHNQGRCGAVGVTRTLETLRESVVPTQTSTTVHIYTPLRTLCDVCQSVCLPLCKVGGKRTGLPGCLAGRQAGRPPCARRPADGPGRQSVAKNAP